MQIYLFNHQGRGIGVKEGLQLFRVGHFSVEQEFEFFTLPSSPFTLQWVP
jgi:hypothetical protein